MGRRARRAAASDWHASCHAALSEGEGEGMLGLGHCDGTHAQSVQALTSLPLRFPPFALRKSSRARRPANRVGRRRCRCSKRRGGVPGSFEIVSKSLRYHRNHGMVCGTIDAFDRQSPEICSYSPCRETLALAFQAPSTFYPRVSTSPLCGGPAAAPATGEAPSAVEKHEATGCGGPLGLCFGACG